MCKRCGRFSHQPSELAVWSSLRRSRPLAYLDLRPANAYIHTLVFACAPHSINFLSFQAQVMENPLWAQKKISEDRKWSMAESHHLENMKDSSVTKPNIIIIITTIITRRKVILALRSRTVLTAMHGFHPPSGSSHCQLLQPVTPFRVLLLNNEPDSSGGGYIQIPLPCAHAFLAMLPLPARFPIFPIDLLVPAVLIHLKQRDI